MGLHSTPSEVFGWDCSPWREVCLSWMLCLNSEMPLRGFSVLVVIYFRGCKGLSGPLASVAVQALQ